MTISETGHSVRGRAAALALAAVALLAAHGVRASDGVEPIGVSMQARARGGADVAVGDSALSQIDNPATLALAPWDQTQFDLSQQVIFVEAPWTGAFETIGTDRRALPLVNMAVAFPVNSRVRAGFAVHSKCGLAADYTTRFLLIPHVKRRVFSDLKVVSFTSNIAYKVSDELAVGVGARFEMASAAFSKVLGPADVEVGRGYGYGAGFQAGLHYRPRPDLSFGLAYRSPSWFSDITGGDLGVSLLGAPGLSLGPVRLSGVQLPQRVSAGVAWDATDWLKLVGETRWIDYSNSAMSAFVVRSERLPLLRYSLPLGYTDQWAFMLGADIKLSSRWTLGVGYHYATAVAPSENLTPLGSILSQHHATIGLRYKRDNWWVGLGYVLAFPSTLDGGGRSVLPLGIDYASGSLKQTQHSLSLGFGFSW